MLPTSISTLNQQKSDIDILAVSHLCFLLGCSPKVLKQSNNTFLNFLHAYYTRMETFVSGIIKTKMKISFKKYWHSAL